MYRCDFSTPKPQALNPKPSIYVFAVDLRAGRIAFLLKKFFNDERLQLGSLTSAGFSNAPTWVLGHCLGQTHCILKEMSLKSPRQLSSCLGCAAAVDVV